MLPQKKSSILASWANLNARERPANQSQTKRLAKRVVVFPAMLPRLAILWVMLGGSVFAKEFSQADREWWAFLPVTKLAVPTVGTGWALNELDHFLARKLETQNLSPAKEADRRTLIRRLSFDLTGLPPS
ncbi:MAG: hypothetical protein CBC62_06355, partial [Opitutia bacterium TMED102]